jgi:hypothetical protein
VAVGGFEHFHGGVLGGVAAGVWRIQAVWYAG